MASHRSTPKTVLNAPTRTVTFRARHAGANRASRRSYLLEARSERRALVKAQRRGEKVRIPKHPKLSPSGNRPYVKPTSDAPVRRSVSARVASVAGRVRSTVAGRREVR